MMMGFRKRDRASDVSAPQSELFEASEEMGGDGSDVALLQSNAPLTAEQLGAILRQTREQQGFSLGEMSRKTRIRDIYLFALEEGSVEKLPGSTFVAGFLRLYAESLALKDTELVERYLATADDSENFQTDMFPAPITSRHRPSVLVVLGGVVGLLGLFFLYENYYSVDFEKRSLPDISSALPQHTTVVPEDPFNIPDSSVPSVADAPGRSLLSRFFDASPKDNGVEEPLDRTEQDAREQDAREQDARDRGRVLEPSVVVDERMPVSPRPFSRESPPVQTLPERPKMPETVHIKPVTPIVETVLASKSKDPAVLIVNRYPEKVRSNSDLVPESPKSISMLASELVWVQIHDEDGRVLKDMVMQPDHLFRVPPGGRFFATLGSAGGVRFRVGNRFIPYLGRPGEEIDGLELTSEVLLKRVKKR